MGTDLRVVKRDELSGHTAQTGGMQRLAAIDGRTGATGLWAGVVTMAPGARSGAHHHGDCESVIYMLSGRAEFRWGERLENRAEAGPGDFVLVPPALVHQEINAGDGEPLQCIVIRSSQENVVVNVESPEA